MYTKPPVKSYSLKELHRMYSTSGWPSYDTFKRWLAEIEDLKPVISGAKKNKHRRILTPAQVESIFKHLGPPELTESDLNNLEFLNV